LADFRVTEVSRSPGPVSHLAITHLGGEGWHFTKDEVVEAVERGAHSFHVLADGRRAEVAIVRGAIGNYLRAKAGNVWTDDLLRLPS